MRGQQSWQVMAGAVAAALAVLVSAPSAEASAVLDEGPGRLVVSRVDVSDRPDIGFVVAPGRASSLAEVRSRLTVRVAGRSLPTRVTSLSPQDLQVVIVPEINLPPDDLALERSALTRLVLDLPAKAQSGVLTTDDPAGTPELTADPTEAVRSLTLLHPGAPLVAPAVRLQAALADFAAGARVRRTVVVATSTTQAAGPAILDHLRRRLAASGTTLFVLDLSATGRSPLAEVAAATGGSVFRPTPQGDMRAPLAGAVRGISFTLSHQYYVRFRHTASLPYRMDVALAGSAGVERASIVLPERNPGTPPPWIIQPIPLPPPRTPARDVVLIGLGVLLVVSSLAYGSSMLVASRRTPRRFARAVAGTPATPASDGLFYVFLLPCLNEEKVILASVSRLLTLGTDDFVVMVIDDDSDDDTAAVVSSLAGEWVRLLRRTAPDARRGKGEALNAAVRELAGGGLLAGRDPDRVIVAIIDADGRLEPTALAEVAPYFADPTVGGVQTGVRINNRHANLLARMQDMEFVIFTEVFQRGRRHLDSVGLGGNGQFMRLSALLDLGPAPWSRSLTEDLDLGVRLLARGWRNDFCSTAAVHQQGLVELRGLVRQRTRWFQGHLQSWRLVPLILRSAPARARADLLYHLSSPLLLLIASLMTASFLVSLLAYGVRLVEGSNPAGWWLLSTYLLAFAPAVAYSVVYWGREKQHGLSFPGAIVLAHVYVVYGLIWYVAGWRAVARILRGDGSWTKTQRTADVAVPAVLATSGVSA